MFNPARPHPVLHGLSAAVLTLASMTPAQAGPVVQPGSSWSISLSRDGDFTNVAHHVASLDGVAETFAFSPNGPVSVTVNESQTDLGGGRAAIDLTLSFTGGDPYPGSMLVLLGMGVNGVQDGFVGRSLQLTQPVELTAARWSAVASSGTVAPFDMMWDYRQLGLDSNWNGAVFSSNVWLGMGTASGIGLSAMTLHFETQARHSVAGPGTLPLLGFALGLLPLARRTRRPAAAGGGAPAVRAW